MRVGLVFGGRSVEHRVSIVSARAVSAGLAEGGHDVVPLGLGPDGSWLDAPTSAAALAGDLDELPAGAGSVAPTLSRLLEAGTEAVFPLAHGTWGEDGTLQGLCEMADLPYAGAGVTASAVAMDKHLCKRLLAAAAVPVVDSETVTAAAFEADPATALERCARLGAPLFVKPSVGGSSVGVRRVESAAALEEALGFALRFDGAGLVERAVPGRELECAVLGYRQLEASAVGEVVPANPFYDYADKYLQDEAGLHAPAELDDDVAERVRGLAVAAFAAIGGEGMARVDFLLDGDELYVNEINTLPGFTRISMFPRLWAVSGLPLPDLLQRLLDIAVERHRDRRALNAGIRDWLSHLA